MRAVGGWLAAAQRLGVTFSPASCCGELPDFGQRFTVPQFARAVGTGFVRLRAAVRAAGDPLRRAKACRFDDLPNRFRTLEAAQGAEYDRIEHVWVRARLPLPQQRILH